jgi:transcriptional regulator
MYTPKQFEVADTAEVHAMMRAHPFAVLVTNGAEGLVATHLPTVLKVDETGPLGRIECHLARPNPQWRSFAADADALLIFQGAEAYIRPGWYPSKAEHQKVVPTWNYAAVHAYGRLEVMQDQAWLLAHVSELSAQQETPFPAPWATSDAPESFIGVMLRGIVGLRFTITRLEGKVKMSQNRELPDRTGVVRGLAERAQGEDTAVAAIVEKLST